jgi:subtilisin family serine protease
MSSSSRDGRRVTPSFSARIVTAIAAAAIFAGGGPSCARTHPARNTQSDLVAFSHVDRAWTLSTGANATVAVIDWQFDPHAAAAAAFVFPASMVPGERMGDLKPWHGAWMVDIVHRVAPEARIIPIIGRRLRPSGYQDFLVQGIRYAADHGAVAVTSSMGPATDSRQFRDAIDFAEQRGTLFVDVHPENVADGDGKFRPCGAGQCDSRIVHAGVVSVPEHPLRPDPARDVFTWPYDLDAKFEDGWGFSNGPPIVGGVIALIKSANPRLSTQQIRTLLAQTAVARDGFRVLDAEAAVRAAMR